MVAQTKDESKLFKMLAMGDHDINYINRNFVLCGWKQLKLAPLHWRCPTGDVQETNDWYNLKFEKGPIIVWKYDHKLIPIGLNNYNLNCKFVSSYPHY